MPRGRLALIPFTPVALITVAVLVAATWLWAGDFPKAFAFAMRHHQMHDLGQVFPQRLSSLGNQVLYVTVPRGTQDVSLSLVEYGWRVQGEAIGDGLYRFVYAADPARPIARESQSLAARVVADGEVYSQSLVYTYHPPTYERLAANPTTGRVVTWSRSTPDIMLLEGERVSQHVATDALVSTIAIGPSGKTMAVAYKDKPLISLRAWDNANTSLLDVAIPGPAVNMAYVSDEIVDVFVTGTRSGWYRLTVTNKRVIPLLRFPIAISWAQRLDDDRCLVLSEDRKVLAMVKMDDHAPHEPSHFWHAQRFSRLVSDIELGPVGVEGTPRHLYVSTTGYAPEGKAVTANHSLLSTLLTFDSKDLSLVRQTTLNHASQNQAHSGRYDRGGGLSDLGIDEDGKLVGCFTGSREVALINGAYPHDARLRPMSDPRAVPGDVVSMGNGRWAISFPLLNRIAIWNSRWLSDESLSWVELPGSENLSPLENYVRYGEALFHRTSRSGVSCQGCHPGGGSDDSPHNIGGHVNVPLPLHLAMDKGPLFRNGHYNDLHALHQDLGHATGGFDTPLSKTDIRLLKIYIQSLSSDRSAIPHADTKRMAQGWSAMQKGDCTRCHVAPSFGSSRVFAAAQVFPHSQYTSRETLKAPSLLGASERSSYLLRDSVSTLRDVIDADENNHHGNMSALSSQEKQNLLYFISHL